MAIRDRRHMSRSEAIADREKVDRERAAERSRRAREHAERNAAAIAAEEEWASMSAEDRAAARADDRADTAARHANANADAIAAEEARKAGKGPAENKALRPATENKGTDSGDSEDNADDEGLESVEMTEAAARRAGELGLTPADFKQRRKSGASGFTVADVERIAKSKGEED